MSLTQEQLDSVMKKLEQLTEQAPYIFLLFDPVTQKIQVASNIAPGPGLNIMKSVMESWPGANQS